MYHKNQDQNNQNVVYIFDAQNNNDQQLRNVLNNTYKTDPGIFERLNDALQNDIVDVFPARYKKLSVELLGEITSALNRTQLPNITCLVCDCCKNTDCLTQFMCTGCGREFTFCVMCINNMRNSPDDFDACCMTSFAIAVLGDDRLCNWMHRDYENINAFRKAVSEKAGKRTINNKSNNRR